MMPKRCGYALIELLTVLLVIGTLAGVGAPRVRQALSRAEAVRVLGDVHALQVAVVAYYQDHGTLPPSSTFGAVPDGLAAYLPAGFGFVRKNVDYAWTALVADAADDASTSSGNPGSAGQGKGQGAEPGKGVNAGGKGRGGGRGPADSVGGAAASAPEAGLWVRYPENSDIAEALKAYNGGFALWSPGQMLFVINP